MVETGLKRSLAYVTTFHYMISLFVHWLVLNATLVKLVYRVTYWLVCGVKLPHAGWNVTPTQMYLVMLFSRRDEHTKRV